MQNALAATAAPFQGQFSGYEAFPQYAAATGEAFNEELKLRYLMILNTQIGAGGGAGYMPYGAYATLPQQGAFNGLTNLPYQNAAAANASLQEARLQ